MAKRYSGDLQISVTYDNRDFYRTSVSRDGKSLWQGTVGPVVRGIANDSPQAYDEVASAALSFADHEVRGLGDEAEYNEEGSGWLIRRTPRARTATTASHATRKSRTPTTTRRTTQKSSPSFRAGDCVTMREPHRKYLTSTTGADVFKVVSINGKALTLEGPLDWHPKHRKQKVMGAHQFKRVACPRFGDAHDEHEHDVHEGPASHGTKSRIVVRKVKGRWQPTSASGIIVRGKIYNADGSGYSTKQGAEEAAEMIRKLGRSA